MLIDATAVFQLGATKPEQIKENVKAIDVLPKLTHEVMEKIEGILDNKPTILVSASFASSLTW